MAAITPINDVQARRSALNVIPAQAGIQS